MTANNALISASTAARTLPALEALTAALSFGVPWVVAAFGAGASMGFYDASELSAAAHGMGVTHPPGHPLWVVLASFATLVPVGSVPLRVALLSGFCVAITSRLLYSVALGLARASLRDPALDRVWDARIAPIAALSVSLLATTGPAVIRQATRVEVYALAAMLAVVTLGLATSSRIPLATRARLSVLVVALGGANHHFIALTAAPVAFFTVIAFLRSRTLTTVGSTLVAWGLMGTMGLAPYVLLFLRADTTASLVRVRTVGDFLWTVSARAFQKNAGAGVPGTFGEHVLDVLEVVGTSLTPAGILMALVGTFTLLRSDDDDSASRATVLRLFVLATVVCLARALLGFIAGNPDAAGYLAPGVVAIACLGVGFPTAFWRAIRTAPANASGPTPAARAILTFVVVVLPLALPFYTVFAGLRDSQVDRAGVPEDAADATLATLPARAVVLAYAPETVFRLRYAQRVEGERPDVTVVPVAFLPYPGMNNSLLAQDPDLLPLVRAYLAHGAPRPEEVGALAMNRPVRIELDPQNVVSMTPFVVPRGMLAEVRGEPTTLASVRSAAASHFAAMDALQRTMAAEPGGALDDKSNELVLWRSYNDAVFFAARGARAEALASLRIALARAPMDTALLGLRDALNAPGDGPVDVRPYVVAAHRPE